MNFPLRLTTLSTSVMFACAAFAQTTEVPAPDQASTATELAPVTVNASADASASGLPSAYAGGQVARGGRVGVLGNQDVMETPFNSTSYTDELIQNQQARSVADVVQNDPSVRVARGYGNFQELYMVRGFPVYSDDMSYNGLYGVLPRQYVATELLERVEVFRGANTFLNGAAPGGSGIGGAINLLPKRAPNEALTQVTVGVESGGQAVVAADLARRFGPDQSTGIRVNAVRRDGEKAIDNEEQDLSALAVGLDYRRSDLRLSADLGFQDNKFISPRPSVTPVSGSSALPSAPDASTNFAQPWTHSNERDTFGTLRGEYDLNDKLTVWAAGGMRHSEESNVLANPRADANGNTTTYRFDNERVDDVKTGEIGVRARINTGSVGHSLSASASAFALDSRNAYAFSNFTGFAGSLYDPVDVSAPVANALIGGNLASPRTTSKIETASLALADTLSFADEQVLLTLGARHQTIQSHSYNYNNGAETSAYKESRVSPMAGLIVRATSKVSLYANYIEGLMQGDIAPTSTSGGAPVTNAGEALAPYVSKQKEIGAKYDRQGLGATLSVFTTTMPSAYLVGNTYEVAGEQRNRGVELSLYGEPVHGLRLLGGVTFLDAKQMKTAGGTYDGNDVIGVPNRQINAGVEWDVPAVRGLTLTGRAIHTSAQFANAANTLKLPSWSRFDLGARYITSLGKQVLTLRARIDNLTDRNYWASAGGSPGANYLVLGAPRTFVLSGTVDF